MKKIVVAVLAGSLILTLAACGNMKKPEAPVEETETSVSTNAEETEEGTSTEETKAEEKTEAEEEDAAISYDLDFKKMNPSAISETLSKVFTEPDSFIGKTIRVSGETRSSVDPETDEPFYTIVIKEVSDEYPYGIEYALADAGAYPKDGEKATITGTFKADDSGPSTIYRIDKATIKIDGVNVQEQQVVEESMESVSES